MSAVNKPNIYVKISNGNLQESYLIKKQKLDKKKLLESKNLKDRVSPDNEEYSSLSGLNQN